MEAAIELVSTTFLARRSAQKVVRHLRDSGLQIPALRHNSEIVWSAPSHARVLRILKNPA